MAGLTVRIKADSSNFEKGVKRVKSELGTLTGAVAGVGVAIGSIWAGVKAFQALGDALVDSSKKAASIESLKVQFETLLGSADAADKRMKDIVKFAATTPYEIEGLARTSKLLQNLGGDVMATGDGLRLVGDAAAIAGQPIEEVGLHIGRLFNAITSGTSAGESVNRLQELGLIGGDVKRKFEDLAAAQKKGTQSTLSSADALRLLQDVMSKTQGAMERLSQTTEGKMSNMKDEVNKLQVAFGEGMNKGVNKGLDALNIGLPQFEAKFREAGQMMGNAITDAVNGDAGKFVAIGTFIGDAIASGLKIGFTSAQLDLGSFMNTRKNWFTGEVNQEDVARNRKDKEQVISGQINDAVESLRIGVQALREKTLKNEIQTLPNQENKTFDNAIQLKSGLYRPAGPNEQTSLVDPNGNRIVLLLEKIAANSEPSKFAN
jgi:hypothetical protein